MSKRPREAEGQPTEHGDSFWHTREPVEYVGDSRFALVAYATQPSRFPGTVLSWSSRFVLVRDKFPKSSAHFMVLARNVPGGPLRSGAMPGTVRVPAALTRAHLDELREMGTFALASAARALAAASASVAGGGGGGAAPALLTGFHALPSLEPLHLHVISPDLCRVKSRRHYNSFADPKLFLALPAVCEMLRGMHGDAALGSVLSPRVVLEQLAENVAPAGCHLCGRGDAEGVPVPATKTGAEWARFAGHLAACRGRE